MQSIQRLTSSRLTRRIIANRHVLVQTTSRALSTTYIRRAEAVKHPHPHHAPKWNEELATGAEAAVKADQSPEQDLGSLQTESVARMHSQSGGSGSKDGDTAPGWNRDAATKSETRVKADRSPPRSVESLQKETVDDLHGDNGSSRKKTFDGRASDSLLGETFASASEKVKTSVSDVAKTISDNARVMLENLQKQVDAITKEEAEKETDSAKRGSQEAAKKVKERVEDAKDKVKDV
ncbi:hypothetical protein BZG36_03848 [Bifiguratus adelaidae]|uniref:Uncharacterized protein n=1 Tax=Bifiguratus adelaidae TaxID=1938954 RepID=A0A261XWI3_9FUNG|nr:hypothetical protein BZG36_03848 [Bifiguratus adelaidae]